MGLSCSLNKIERPVISTTCFLEQKKEFRDDFIESQSDESDSQHSWAFDHTALDRVNPQ